MKHDQKTGQTLQAEPVLLSVRAAAKRLGCSAGLIYALVAAAKLTHRRIGLGRGKIMFTEEDISSFLESRKVGPREATPKPRPRRSKVRFEHLHLG